MYVSVGIETQASSFSKLCASVGSTRQESTGKAGAADISKDMMRCKLGSMANFMFSLSFFEAIHNDFQILTVRARLISGTICRYLQVYVVCTFE